MTGSHAVYRFFDAHGNLLYVGLTCNPGRRWDRHRQDKAWWEDVARVDVEKHPNRDAAALAERKAITDEKPRHNIRMNGGGIPMARAKLATEPVDRMSAADAPLHPDSLVGSFFLSDAGRGWQGRVVAEPHPGIFLVETFEWVSGSSYAQELVQIGSMDGWNFYDTADWMVAAYENGVERRWEHERQALKAVA